MRAAAPSGAVARQGDPLLTTCAHLQVGYDDVGGVRKQMAQIRELVRGTRAGRGSGSL
jgi:hypothetical protein